MRIEGLLGGALGHQFDAAEQAPSADVADVGMSVEALSQRRLEPLALPAHVRQQVVLADDALHGERGGARRRVTHIGVPVLEESRAVTNGGVDLGGDHESADGLVARSEAFGDGDHVAGDSVLLAGEQRAGAPHPAHDLVEDQEDAVVVADLADAPEVARHGGHGARRGADHGLRDEGEHRLRAELFELGLELVGRPQAVVLLGLVIVAVAIGVAGRDVM